MRPKTSESSAYISRNTVLREMGYRTYALYLKSPLWRRIRKAQLKLHPDCSVCGRVANQVHHKTYSRRCLEGKLPRMLVSLCEPHHKACEFDGQHKLNPAQAGRKLERMTKNAAW